MENPGMKKSELPPRSEVRLFVPGRAAPQGSKTYLGNGRMRESSIYVKPWRTDVREALLAEWHPAPPIAGPVDLRLDFVLARPTSTPKRRTPFAIKRPDWDKLSRAVCDAIQSAGVYRDDSQIVCAFVTKRLANIDETPGCFIHVRAIGEGNYAWMEPPWRYADGEDSGRISPEPDGIPGDRYAGRDGGARSGAGRRRRPSAVGDAGTDGALRRRRTKII